MPADSPPSSTRPGGFSRRDWGVVLVLAAVQFTHMVDFVIIMPLGDKMMDAKEGFGISPDQFSYVIGVYGLAAGVASLLASLVFDRFDRKHVLIASYAGFAVSTFLCGLADSYALMLASRASAGAFGGLAAAAIMAIIGDAFRPDQRGKATATVMSAFAVASVAGLPAGLYLAGRFDRGAPFVALAGLSLFVLAGIAWVLPAFRAHLLYARRNVLAEFAVVVREPRHQFAFVFTLSLVLGTFTVASFLGPYFLAANRAAGWTEHRELAIVYFVGGLLTFLSMGVIGRVADRYPKRSVFLVMGGISLVLCLVVTTVPPSSLFVATVMLSAFMVAAVGRMVPAQAMLIGVPLARNRGAFMSLNTAVSNLSTGLAPVIAGLLLTKHADGTLSGYPLVGAFSAAAAGVSLWLSKYLRPVVAAQESAAPAAVPAAAEVAEQVAAV